MILTTKEVCIFHMYNVPPSRMARFTSRWDLPAANAYHVSLAHGNNVEQVAAANLSVMEVYQTMLAFLTREGLYADVDLMGAYIMDQEMYVRLRRYLYGDMEEIA